MQAKTERNIAIVLSGGSGKRMGSDIPKQYLKINEKEALFYPLKCIQESFVDEIVLVCAENYIDYCSELFLHKYALSKISMIVPGGNERYDSVYNGLKAIAEKYHLDMENEDSQSTYVYIHDGARVCLDEEVLKNCYEDVRKYGACIPAVSVKDTIKVASSDGFVSATPDRSMLKAVQTPQTFRFDLIYSAYQKMKEQLAQEVDSLSLKITDDAMVYEHFNSGKVYLAKGSDKNIKITTPEDLIVASEFLK